MRTRSKLILAALTASLLMGLAVSSASASRLSVNRQNFDIIWTELILTDEVGEGVITCEVTLSGSFHSLTITKSAGLLIGYVTSASVDTPNCEGGSAIILDETLPWHVTYEGFRGSLPNITSVQLLLRNVAFEVTVFGFVVCLYEDDAIDSSDQASGSATLDGSGNVTGLTPDPGIRLPLQAGGFFCPDEGGFEGAGAVTDGGDTDPIVIRLV